MKHIKPEKMAREVRLLWETAELRGLSPESIAPIVGVGFKTIYNWFAGQEPFAAQQDKIRAAVELIDRKFPIEEGRAFRRGGASWVPDDPKDPRVLNEKRRLAKMQLLFFELERRLSPAEKALLVQEEPAWTGFQEILGLIRKHGLKIPRS